MYSIKAVSQATGLTVETLRAWERRYRVVVPERDGTGRRVYRAEDVLRLRRLREATERGHPIGRLVHLDEPALAGLIEASPAPDATPSPGHRFVERMLDAAGRYAAAECEQALTLAVSLLPPERLVADVLEPLLREVGERWHEGTFSIAQERLVSSVVRRHVGLIVDALGRTAGRGAAVFATLPGERHELGLLMSAMLCASHGLRIHYLGPDLPPEEVARYARESGVDLVALSVLLADAVERLPGELARLRAALGPGVPVWVGGQGAQSLARESLPEDCIVIDDAAELSRRLDLLVH